MAEMTRKFGYVEVDLHAHFPDDTLRNAVGKMFDIEPDTICVVPEDGHSTPGSQGRIELINADTNGWGKQTVTITHASDRYLTQPESHALLMTLCAELGTELVFRDADFRNDTTERGEHFWVTADGSELIDIKRDYDTERIEWFRSKVSDYYYTDEN